MATMAEATDRRPGRPRDARVDQLVIDATLAEVADKGFIGASIESIAARAGVGKAAIYRRWASREALLRFVALQITDTCEATDTGDLRRDLLAIFEPLAAQFYEGGAARLMPSLVAEASRDGAIRALLTSLAQERRQGALDALARAAARGELRRSVDPELVVDLVAGSLLYRFLLLGEPIEPGTARQALDLVLDGILK